MLDLQGGRTGQRLAHFNSINGTNKLRVIITEYVIFIREMETCHRAIDISVQVLLWKGDLYSIFLT